MSGFLTVMRALLMAALVVVGTAGAASADRLLGGYWAWIGKADLHNSRGVRLTSPVDVLRQDRANVHRFGIMQAGDTWDPWFGSIEVRAAIPALVKAGVIGPRARQVLLNGRGRIYVAVYGTRRGLTRLVVRMNPPS